MALFTHLKNILLQFFHFSDFSNKWYPNRPKVEKQLKVSFLTTIAYFDWVANIVLMPKKYEKVRMCVNYRDLNRASMKDNFPLPYIDTLIDNTATNMFFSFSNEFLAL